jgi:hypothetical protein
VPKKSEAIVLRVELLGIEPLVWRRVRVLATMTLRALHDVLQTVMGWQDCHLHQYRVGDVLIGMTEPPELDVPEGMEEEAGWTVADVVKTGVSEFEYLYDFGDDWQHRIIVEPAVRSRAPGSAPLCLAGENACPPEDVGGHLGYARFLEALADASHPEHGTYVDWIGGVWDPKGFDLNWVNRELRERLKRKRG